MIFKVCAFALFCAVCTFLLKDLGWRGTPLLAIAALVFVLDAIVPMIIEPFSKILGMAEEFGVDEVAKCVVKVVGIGYLCGICSDICEELGAPRAASGIVLFSRVEIGLVALPYFVEIIEMVCTVL